MTDTLTMYRRFKHPRTPAGAFGARGGGTVSLASGLVVVIALIIFPMVGRIAIPRSFYADLFQTKEGYKFRPPSFFRSDCTNGPASPLSSAAAGPRPTRLGQTGKAPSDQSSSYEFADYHNLPLCGAPLGTDQRGTNILWRLIHGMEFIWIWGVPSAVFALVAGLLLGVAISWWHPPLFPGHHSAVGGWRSWAGRLLAGSFDLLDLFPRIMLLLLVTTIHGITLFKFSVAVAVVLALQVAAGIRQQFATLRHGEAVAAAEELGVSPRRVVWGHIVWHHLRGFIASQFAFAIGAFILWDATIGYLGYGELGHNTWGQLIREGVNKIVPWMTWSASIVTVVSAFALFKLSDGLEKWRAPR